MAAPVAEVVALEICFMRNLSQILNPPDHTSGLKYTKVTILRIQSLSEPKHRMISGEGRMKVY